MNSERYLERIGLGATDIPRPDRESLERLQEAHVTAVPFETLSITGHPFGDRKSSGAGAPNERPDGTANPDGEGVSLDRAHLYEKVVERRRGGFCYELNGLFGWLLGELGFDADRVAARVVNDGTARPPANHLTHVVEFDRRYVTDVGTGTPQIRRPVPLDGTVVADAADVEWRVVESNRPDAEYLTQYQEQGDDGWTDRYVFRDRPRPPGFFEATCEYLQSAPESPFTGDPVVAIASTRGYKRLSTETFTEKTGGESREKPVAPEEWDDVLEREFGVRYPANRTG